jgi:hypothetical protein
MRIRNTVKTVYLEGEDVDVSATHWCRCTILDRHGGVWQVKVCLAAVGVTADIRPGKCGCTKTCTGRSWC